MGRVPQGLRGWSGEGQGLLLPPSVSVSLWAQPWPLHTRPACGRPGSARNRGLAVVPREPAAPAVLPWRSAQRLAGPRGANMVIS